MSKRLVFDVGMHGGEDTAYYLALGLNVVAVEAMTSFCELATARFSREVASGQLVIENVAVAEDRGPVAFYVSSSSVWGTIHESWARRNEELGSSVLEEIQTLGVKFDDLLERHGTPHYLKVDIEGSDLLCLNALRGREKPNYLSFESEKISWTRLEEEFRLLSELGYAHFKVVPQHKVQRRTAGAPEGTDAGWRFPGGSSGAFGEDAPGRWMSSRQAMLLYRFIFLRYKLIGDAGVLTRRTHQKKGFRAFVAKLPARLVRIVIGRPGWYDTHARLTPTFGSETL